MSQRPSGVKKPAGGRPVPKRLFSFDSLRKDKSSSGYSSNNDAEEVKGNGSTLRLIDNTIHEDTEDPFASAGSWTEKPLVTSPVALEDSGAKGKGRQKSTSKPLPLTLEGSDGKDVLVVADDTSGPPSPSRRRWETIRHHVLPVEPTQRPGSPFESPVASPARPSTPKGYRFGQKRHVRQIVDEARAVDEVRKFADDILRACWAVRFGVGSGAGKPEREASQGTVGSGVHIPFMSSSASLPLSSSASVVSLQMSYRPSNGPRRPPSMGSLAMTGNAAASVALIARALTSTTSSNRPRQLPHEQLVLSALMIPFFAPADQSEAERGTAVETFTMIINTWRAHTNENALDRCLWCCKIATLATDHRPRILGALARMLFPKDRPFLADTPLLLQTLVQALVALLADLAGQPNTAKDTRQISSYIDIIRGNECGQLPRQAVEKEYGVRFSKSDNDSDVRLAVVAESVVKCLESGHENRRRWVLHHLLEDYWPTPEPSLSLTPLLACIRWRKLKTFIASSLSLLSLPADNAEVDGETIIRLFRSRILPGVEAMRTDDAADIQTQLVRLVFELLSVQESDEREYILMHFCDWYQNKKDWKESIHSTLAQFIRSADWLKILHIVPIVTNELPGEIQLPLITHVMPLIYERLVSNPPSAPSPRLTAFLDVIAQSFPKVFYKPVFSCAAASKETTVINQLLVLNALTRFVPDLWIRDPEMFSFALTSNSTTHPQSSIQGGLVWGKARVGQSALVLEITQRLSIIRGSRDMAQTVSAIKFANQLEARLGPALVSKEQSVLIADSQRILFSGLLREIRLLTRSLKSAVWLPTVVSWFTQWSIENYPSDKTITRSDEREDPQTALNKLLAIYTQAQDTLRSSTKRNTITTSPPLSPVLSRTTSEDKLKANSRAPFEEQLDLLRPLTHMLRSTILELLVSVSGLLSTEDYVRLAPPLWKEYMDESEPRTIAPTCFLVMQCAEKTPSDFTQLVEDSLSSVDPTVRFRAIQRFSKLASWRHQMLSQEIVLDRTHRRPFKLARPPILFVATDIGSSLFVYEEVDDEWKDSHGHILPLELRRRLSEIGWAQEDRKVDQKTQWVRTPMSLIPSLQLVKIDSNHADAFQETEAGSPSASPEPSPTRTSPRGDITLTRQDSTSTSSGRSGVRRRPVFVMTLISLFPRMTAMLLDRDFSVANAALDLVMDFMRDDPTLLARAVFSLLASDEEGLSMAISTLRAFLHARQALPPAMAHHALNHLTGFLKSSMKHALGTANPLQSYAYSMPIIANLITQVSDLSMREIRRAKIDTFLTPTGSLWFPPSAPMGPQFPRSLRSSNNPFETLPPQLVWITLVRCSQNKLFLSMLKRDPQDIKIIRKHMTRLVLPSLDTFDDDSPLTLNDMLPRRQELSLDKKTHSDTTLNILSVTLARSYLLLICQVFQAMSRHLSDRQELAILVDGVSRILITHGRDINIVAHCMIAYMTSSTRFRRLFTSGGGYTLFMPAVVKAYVEAEGNPGVRAAIEYATNRFYALHEDSFVFQAFDVLSNVVTMPGIDGPWVADGIYSLFSSLRHSIPPPATDIAGIHGVNKVLEKEALMMTMVEQVPQTFLASFRRGSKQEKGQNSLNVPIPEEYEGRRLGMDNLVRMFLTVIAHNPTIQRAESFLRVLRLLAPNLYHASSSTRTVLRDGIFALANILLSRSGGKTKSSDPILQNQPPDGLNLETINEGLSQAASQPGALFGDLIAMRLDFLSLVVAYSKAGGLFSQHASQRILEVVKAILKDSRLSTTQVSAFVADYAKSILIRDPLPPLKQVNAVLAELAPIVSAYFGSVDFSGLYNVVAELASNSVFATEPSFATLVVTQYCRYGLDACELAASENLLFRMDIRASLLHLIESAVSMTSVDVVKEIQSRTPSRDLLAGIVLPFAMRLKTTEEVTTASQYTDVWRRDAHSRAWVQLLSYVLHIIESAEDMKGSRKSSDRRKSGESDRVDTAAVMTFAMALQVLKIIVVRAEDDISSSIPGIWARMGAVVKLALSDGGTSFALRSSYDYSEPASPSFSPRTSTLSSQPPMQLNFPSSVSMHQRRPLSPPRMIDYLAWSFIQWLWLRRNPLVVQMRIYVQERVAVLAQELAQGHLLSGVSAPRSRRISAVFSKPRRSMMGPNAPSSAVSTPRNSIFLSTSTSFPLPADSSLSSLSPYKDNSRVPGYARITSPNSANAQDAQELAVPRIVHLGPVITSFPGRSPGGSHIHMRSIRSMAKEMTVTSPMLIRATYRRIRLVQHLMGFRDLLPMGDDGGPFGEDDHPESEVKAWTKRDALEAVTQETRDLLDEFRDHHDEVEDESAVLVDSEETLLQFQELISSSSH